ncbi:MAG: NAD(P)-dependent oxidoreductase [Thermoproteota archaeon]
MKVLITGTGGMGAHISKVLTDNNVDTSLYGTCRQTEAISKIVDISKIEMHKGDILDHSRLEEVIKENNIDHIIHTAGPRATQCRNHDYTNDSENGIRVHTMGTSNVLEASRKLDIKRVIYTSTGSVYLANKYPPEVEAPLKETDPVVRLDSEDIYASGKVACEYQGFNYAKAYGIEFASIRMAHVFGPWPGDMGRGRAVGEMVQAFLNDQEITVEEQVAQWTHLYDLAEEHYAALIAQNIKHEVFNAGSGRISGLSDVKDVLAKKGDVSKINVDTSKKSSKKLQFDMTSAEAKLNFKPKYDLELGVETLIKWYSK